MLIDTSILVELFRDKSGRVAREVEEATAGRDYWLTRFTQMELLQGARDNNEWLTLEDYLNGQDYIEMSERSWADASRLYFDMRRQGLTVRSVVDCCIAQLALEHGLALLHNDRDFDKIGRIRQLRHVWLETRGLVGFHDKEGLPISDD
jgi:predicted nucleic acid-binding protein